MNSEKIQMLVDWLEDNIRDGKMDGWAQSEWEVGMMDGREGAYESVLKFVRETFKEELANNVQGEESEE